MANSLQNASATPVGTPDYSLSSPESYRAFIYWNPGTHHIRARMIHPALPSSASTWLSMEQTETMTDVSGIVVPPKMISRRRQAGAIIDKELPGVVHDLVL